VKLPKIIQAQATPLSLPTAEKEKKERLNGFLRSELVESFRDLRLAWLAIENSLGVKTRPEQTPFLIHSHYTRNLGQSKSAVERVLVAQERLETFGVAARLR